MDYKISLAAARVNANITQSEAAQKLNVSRVTLVSWEKGKTKIPFEALTNLCSLYKVPIDLICVPNDLTNSKV